MSDKKIITVEDVKEVFEQLYDEWIDKIQEISGGFNNAFFRILNTFRDHPEVKLPSKEEIEAEVEEYGFCVPYDGSNRFYDEGAIHHFKAGANFVIDYIKKQK